MVDIICLGEPMVEFNQTNEEQFVRGFGGDTSNCAISAARQGAAVGYLTRLGNDQFGDSLIALWQSEGIDTSKVARDANHATGIYFVSHDTEGHHYTYYRQNSAASVMSADDLPEKYIAESKILHVSAISQAISDSAAQSVNHAIDIANQNNTQVSYDTNLRLALWPLEKAKTVIHESMSRCQIALPSLDDARLLTGLDEHDAIVDFYLELGPELVVLKLGSAGVIVADHHSRTQIKPLQVDSIDANGAGDIFAGALLSQIILGIEPVSAARYANATAALSTTRAGAVTSIPTAQEVETFNATNEHAVNF